MPPLLYLRREVPMERVYYSRKHLPSIGKTVYFDNENLSLYPKRCRIIGWKAHTVVVRFKGKKETDLVSPDSLFVYVQQV